MPVLSAVAALDFFESFDLTCHKALVSKLIASITSEFELSELLKIR